MGEGEGQVGEPETFAWPATQGVLTWLLRPPDPSATVDSSAAVATASAGLAAVALPLGPIASMTSTWSLDLAGKTDNLAGLGTAVAVALEATCTVALEATCTVPGSTTLVILASTADSASAHGSPQVSRRKPRSMDRYAAGWCRRCCTCGELNLAQTTTPPPTDLSDATCATVLLLTCQPPQSTEEKYSRSASTPVLSEKQHSCSGRRKEARSKGRQPQPQPVRWPGGIQINK